jgi:hypothetical protein
MEDKALLVAPMLIKDINVKTLVTNDKSAWIKLETILPETIEQLKNLIEHKEVYVVITPSNE